MNGLNMKNFSSKGEGSSSLDLSHLENNPKYKPDEGSKQEPDKGQPATTSTGLEGGDPNNNKPEGGQTNSGSSLENNANQEPTGKVEVTDDMILKSLSEKLGREVTFESLNQKPVELDPDVKAINDWKSKTGRPLEDFFKYQKDYSQVSDLDVVREALQLQYPSFTAEEINMELAEYITSEDDFDDDKAKKSLALKKLAIEGRKKLSELKAELSEPSTNYLTPEVKKKLEFAESVQKQLEQDNLDTSEYFKNIKSTALSTEDMKLQLSEELSIDFKLSEEMRAELPKLIDEMPHWRNEDGSWNHQAVVGDAIKIKYFDRMIQLAFEQGQNAGTDGILKNAKNSTLGDPKGQEQGTGKKKPVIEGFDIDKALGKQSMKFRFGK